MSGCHDTNVKNEFLEECDKFKDDMEKADKFIQCLAGLELKLMDRIDEVLRNCVKEDSKLEKYIIELQLMVNERITNLETVANTTSVLNRKTDSNYATLADHIDELTKWKVTVIEKNIQDMERIRVLEIQYKELYQYCAELESRLNYKTEKKQNKCPICDGNGIVRTLNTMDYPCKSCEGKGIIWG